MRKILTVIPIRSGSQGIKNKNVKFLSGKPLVSYAISAARGARNCEKLIVSTDSESYASIAREYGVEAPFIRPEELGSSEVRLHHVIKHALNYYDALGEHYDAVMSLQATVPLIKSSTINQVIDKFHKEECQAVGTVSEIRHGHPYIAKMLAGVKSDIAVDFIELDKGVPRYPRQVRPALYFFNGAVFLRDRKLLDEMNEDTNCLGTEPRVVFMQDEESINIDEEIDFELAEFLLKKRSVRGQ